MGPDVQALTGFSAIPYGVGVAIYAFEGVSMILPLELAMEKKHRFGGVLAVAFLFIALIYGVSEHSSILLLEVQPEIW